MLSADRKLKTGTKAEYYVLSVAFPRCTKQGKKKRLDFSKMRWSSAGFFFIDILWCFLACSFFIALCVHNIWRKHKSCRVYMLFQDLIRYGKTKQNGKRDEWLRVLDVPKR